MEDLVKGESIDFYSRKGYFNCQILYIFFKKWPKTSGILYLFLQKCTFYLCFVVKIFVIFGGKYFNFVCLIFCLFHNHMKWPKKARLVSFYRKQHRKEKKMPSWHFFSAIFRTISSDLVKTRNNGICFSNTETSRAIH